MVIDKNDEFKNLREILKQNFKIQNIELFLIQNDVNIRCVPRVGWTGWTIEIQPI